MQKNCYGSKNDLRFAMLFDPNRQQTKNQNKNKRLLEFFVKNKMDSSADSATASAGDPKSKEWQDEVKAAGSLPGSKNVRHKSHAFGDPDKLRYQKVVHFRCVKSWKSQMFLKHMVNLSISQVLPHKKVHWKPKMLEFILGNSPKLNDANEDSKLCIKKEKCVLQVLTKIRK